MKTEAFFLSSSNRLPHEKEVKLATELPRNMEDDVILQACMLHVITNYLPYLLQYVFPYLDMRYNLSSNSSRISPPYAPSYSLHGLAEVADSVT